MSNYTKSTNFATKDNLSPGDPLKVVRGTEIDTEFNNISTAIATKTDNSAAAITGGTISGITDLAVADGGTGASTAAAALNNLLPSQTSAANKYLQSDGTNASWDAVSLSTADITGTLAVANGGTGVTASTGTGSVVLSNSPTLVTPALGTPSALVGTNITGTASGLTAGNVTTNANLTGAVTSVGNATSLGSFTSANLLGALTDETGTGSAVFATSPTLVTPILGTPTSATLTNATGLPIATGVSGLGTGIATALAVNTGSAGAPVLFNGALGTPSSGTVTNLTGTASININGTVGATTATTGAFTTVSATGAVTTDASFTARSSGTSAGIFGSGLQIGGSGNDLIIYGQKAGSIILYPNTTQVATFSSTGLAITGTLSASGVSTFSVGGSEIGRFNATGLGIGTSSPRQKLSVGATLDLYSGGANTPTVPSIRGSASNNLLLNAYSTGVTYINFDGGTGGFVVANGAGGSLMVVDSSGNLGVGTASPSGKFNSSGSSSAGYIANSFDNTASDGYVRLNFRIGSSGANGIASIKYAPGLFMQIGPDSNDTTSPIVFMNNNATERARITSAGQMLVGTTSLFDAERLGVVAATTQRAIYLKNDTAATTNTLIHNAATSGDNVFIGFGTEAAYTGRGSITYNRAGGLTVYNTTSDYRAKDISGAVTNSGALIDSVPVYMGKMKWATEERPMFIAHEVPAYAHTGEKDAVDADGNPVYQQMDASALIPVMWAEIQSLRARVAQLETN